MYIHYPARVVFLAHPRTASNAVATALQTVGFKKKDPPSSHHQRLYSPGSPVTQENRKDWVVMTTVRNHWDATLSWTFRRNRYKSEANTNQDGTWKLEVIKSALGDKERTNLWVGDHTMWHLHGDQADIILRYESLQNDLGVLADYGIEVPTLTKVNTTPNRDTREYRPFYSTLTAEYIGARFKAEIEQFGYEF